MEAFTQILKAKMWSLNRYEREVNYGHRSAIKKILEGDASPASAMILCVSAIRSHSDHAAKVELTDGW